MRFSENIFFTDLHKIVAQFPSSQGDFLLLMESGCYFKCRINRIFLADSRILGRENRDSQVPGKPFPSPIKDAKRIKALLHSLMCRLLLESSLMQSSTYVFANRNVSKLVCSVCITWNVSKRRLDTIANSRLSCSF